MNSLDLYQCNVCGNLLFLLESSGIVPTCCGETMELLPTNTNHAFDEKHVPIITRDGMTVSVSVGRVHHPMIESHFIKWIILVTDYGIYVHRLNPADNPQAQFYINPTEKIIAAYAFCNLHGLWINTPAK
ncbi:MAG: desulfoferrodoxin Dfx [Lachnospiraceae bacterium]|nr:desulfoferrodoxin Dfx [Lachnospiraceae bacterium]